jgi:CsoR family transcriptional regulator, copper-sensing transcriptional repressor
MPGVNEQICLSPEVKEEIVTRLKRAEGQIRGIQKMLEEERSCQDLVIQLAAVKEAITQAGLAVLGNQLIHCLTTEIQNGGSVDQVSKNFMEIFKKLS